MNMDDAELRYDRDMILVSLITGRCDACGDVLQVDEEG